MQTLASPLRPLLRRHVSCFAAASLASLLCVAVDVDTHAVPRWLFALYGNGRHWQRCCWHLPRFIVSEAWLSNILST